MTKTIGMMPEMLPPEKTENNSLSDRLQRQSTADSIAQNFPVQASAGNPAEQQRQATANSIAQNFPGSGAPGGQAKPQKMVRRKAKAEAKKIGCPQCAAPIEIRNYTMSDMVTCSYCGAVVDLSGDKDKVVRQILLENRPSSTLKLGMKGKVRGSLYEVIGRIKYKGWDDGESFFYNEYLLFNPQRGYGWLQQDEGNWTFLKKLRNKPEIHAKTAVVGDTFSSSGTRYIIKETGSAIVDYVEGEFTYHIEKGNRTYFLDGVAQGKSGTVSAEWSDKELEWLAGSPVAGTDIASAFNVKVPPGKPASTGGYGSGMGTSYNDTPSSSEVLGFGLSGWSFVFSSVAVCLIMISYMSSGFTLVSSNINFSEWLAPSTTAAAKNPEKASGHTSRVFNVTEPTIIEVAFSAPVSNAWIFLEVELIDSHGETYHAFTNQISYYSGYDWSEGSQHSETYFKLSKAGKYTLNVSGTGGKGSYGKVPPKITVRYSVKEGVIMTRYFIILLLIGGLPILIPLFFSMIAASMEAD